MTFCGNGWSWWSSPWPDDCEAGRGGTDAFYLIRLGFVKVTQEFAGGEMVLTYLSRGSYFGEIGLLPPVFQVTARGEKRSFADSGAGWAGAGGGGARAGGGG